MSRRVDLYLIDTVCIIGRFDQMMVVGAMVYIVLNFVARGVLSLLETLGTPIFLEYVQPFFLADSPFSPCSHH